MSLIHFLILVIINSTIIKLKTPNITKKNYTIKTINFYTSPKPKKIYIPNRSNRFKTLEHKSRTCHQYN